MSPIKSSLEIAMERTQDVRADKGEVEAQRLVTEGKKLVSTYFEDAKADLTAATKAFSRDEQPRIREGVGDALLANLSLPADEVALKRNKRAGEGFRAVVSDTKKLDMILGQLDQFYSEYLDERNRIQDEVRAQYEPRRKQKEEEMSKKLGRPVRVDPAQDPEFVQFLRRNVNALEERYGAVLQQVKDEIKSMSGRS